MKDHQSRLNELVAKLKEQGGRLTPQRMAVLQVLVSSETHLSAEQVYEQVQASFPMISRATVYKTVALLKEMDEVLELGFGDGGNRYDANRPDPHPHLICVECNRVTDVELHGLGDLMEKVDGRSGYRVFSHRLDFYGICPACQLPKSQ